MTDAAPTNPDPQRAHRRVLGAIVLIVLIGTTIAAMDKAFDGMSAFIRWRPQVLDLVAGHDVYAIAEPYPNTPIVALGLWPLAKLPPAAGAIIFYLFKVAMVAMSIIWAIRLARGRRGTLPATAIGLILLLCARPIMSDLQHGNINIVVLFLLMAGLAVLASGRSFRAGLILGLAAIVKVTPGLFGLYLLYKRQWSAALGVVAGGLLAVAAPALVLGPQRTADLHVAWFDRTIRPYALEGQVQFTEHTNQSLPAVFLRLFTDSPGVDQDDELGFAFINIASISRPTARRIIAGIILALLAWLALVCRAPTRDARDWRLAGEWALVLIAMLLISARSWKHHYVTMTLPFAVMVAHVWLGDPPTWLRRLLIGVIVFALVMMLGMNGEMIGWIHRGVAHKYVEGFGSYFWFAFGTFVAISMILRRELRLTSNKTET